MSTIMNVHNDNFFFILLMLVFDVFFLSWLDYLDITI